MHIKHRLICGVLVASMMPVPILDAAAAVQPYRQDFLITAYYSPKPDQCCYVRGSYEADRTLNGNGTNGASGVPVHAGMAAAPGLYPFGTRIELPGIGSVTVQDRGGAINQLPDGVHRLDLWAGEGEEGLARALAFGLRRVTGTVYPAGTEQPAESLALSSLPAGWGELTPLLVGDDQLMHVEATKGDRSASVFLLQQILSERGFSPADKITGFFGPETQKSLQQFLSAVGLNESATALSRRTAAFLLAAGRVSREQVIPQVSPSSPPARISEVQRLLRFFGYYKGRTHGKFDGNLRRALIAFQKDQGVIALSGERGAGTVGPRTRTALVQILWQRKVARRAENFLLLARIDDLVLAQNRVPSHFLGKGEKGEQVLLLQKLLAERGFLPAERATGFFGAETQKAVIAFQKSRGIIKTDRDRGAGTMGPGTRQTFLAEVRSRLLSQVRSEGWKAL